MKYAYKNAKILDGTKDMQVQEGLMVLTDGEKIVDLIPEGTPVEGYKEIDLGGKYLMPGLINMHVHLAGNGKPQKKQRDNEKVVKTLMGSKLSRALAYQVVASFAKLEVLSGVTTIRTVGGLGNFDTRLRDDIAAGKKVGPRILAANEGISVPGGHMAGSVAIAAGSIKEAVSHVEEAKKEQVDLIKLMITGGVLDAKEKGVPGELKMDPAMVRAVCDRAHELGYKVAAHVESTEGVRVALQNGVDSIEHGAKMDEEMSVCLKSTEHSSVRRFPRHSRMPCSTVPSQMRVRWSSTTEMLCLRALSSVQSRRLRMTFRSYSAMMSAARGSHSMISGGSLSISRDTSVYRTHLPCIPRPAVLPRWQASGRRQVRLQRENAPT